MHRFSRPSRQSPQAPQLSMKWGATRSPSANPVTPAPTSATAPAASTPMTCGMALSTPKSPLRRSVSQWFTPEA